MAIITKEVELNGVNFKYTYSDNNKVIHKIGTEEYYNECYDILNSIYEYEETNQDIEQSISDIEQNIESEKI